MNYVGKGIPAVDAVSKASGRIRFLQDVQVPGMLHAKMVFPNRPHAVITHVSFEKALSVCGVVAVASAGSVPGENRVGLVVDDQPLFAESVVRYEADCVATVAAADEEAARRGASLVEVEYRDLASVCGLDESMGGSARVHEGGNLIVEHRVKKGDVAKGQVESDFVVDVVFESPVQEHAYLETLGALAVPIADGSVEIVAPVQCPFYVRDAVARCLGLTLSKVRVLQLPLGGGFGGKEDVPSEICSRVAVLAVMTGRPVRMVLSREEDMLYTSKRHPMRLRYRLGCDRRGRLKFADIGISADVGAYATLSPIVLYRSTVHAAGPYDIPHVSITTRGYYTNTAPKGAMRGFGTPQVVFACEGAVDELARRASLDPLDFRLLNCLRQGSQTATGQVLEESVGLAETLERARVSLGPGPARLRPEQAKGRVIRARGCASMFYGVSLGAIGRSLDRAGAKVQLLKDGSLIVFIGCTDIGQGALTVIAQIAAETMGVDVSRVSVNRVDTHAVSDSGPTVASRTTVMSGNAVIDACSELKKSMLAVARELLGPEAVYDAGRGCVVNPKTGMRLGIPEIVKECYARRIDCSAVGWYVAPDCEVDRSTGQGKAYYTYSFATDLAEVEVDAETGLVSVAKFAAAHDSGKIINPLTASSQVEGGIAQGIGLALFERFGQVDGHAVARDLATYLVPTALDVCDAVSVAFVEHASKDGPYGAKGLGEPAIIPVAAAIANAISNALGVRVTSLPVDPEWVMLHAENRLNPLDA